MAILSITSITVPSPAGDGQYVAGEAIAAGEVVYLDDELNKVFLAQCDVVADATVLGFAVNSAALGQSVSINESQVMTINAAATASTLYFLSTTPGKLFLETDLVSTNGKSLVCVASDTSTLVPRIWNTGLLVP
jgi:hypothetical protein